MVPKPKPPVKELASYERLKIGVTNFSRVFGSKIVSSLKPRDLENYQEKRAKDGLAPASLDMEISLV
jgi:hypothetical protein